MTNFTSSLDMMKQGKSINHDINVRIAINDDGKRIGELVKANGFQIYGLDWDDIMPYWLVAEKNGQITGTIMVSLGKPIGRLEMMAINQEMPHKTKTNTVKALLTQGMATLRKSGSQIVMGAIPFRLKSYKKILQRKGGNIAFSGNMFIYPLAY